MREAETFFCHSLGAPGGGFLTVNSKHLISCRRGEGLRYFTGKQAVQSSCKFFKQNYKHKKQF